MALHRLGRLDEALAALDRTVGLDPAYSLALGNRRLVLFDVRRFDEAVHAQLAALTRIGPAAGEVCAWTLHNLALAGRKAGRFAAVVAAPRAELEVGNTDSENGRTTGTNFGPSGAAPPQRPCPLHRNKAK